MRIQHNIMAMNAYRNYNTNTSALSKNLEKLSSGYKINRAGDDAAGLAISEKMRAQITGLNAAQKNVKDGISLVKTAEGAMQEIQDMLNRMDYLATQSANGTYDNEVDRKNLQKEVDALNEEIERIAKSANFNGIKLLDGSQEPGGAASTSSQWDAVSDVTVFPTKDGVQAARTAAKGKYEVDFTNLSAKVTAAGTYSIKIAGVTIAKAVVNASQVSGGKTFELKVANFTAVTAATASAGVAIAGKTFVGNYSGGKYTFEMKETPTSKFTTALNVTLQEPSSKLNQAEGAAVRVIQEAIAAEDRKYAQATFTLANIKDGSQIKIGNDVYTFAVGKDSKETGSNVVNLKHLEESDAGLAAEASRILSKVAANNTQFKVTTDNNTAKVYLTEKEEAKFDYTKQNLAGTTASTTDGDWSGLVKFSATKIEAKAATGGLQLQIGDTSDDYNQLMVKIGSMMPDKLGTAGLKIDTVDSASDAIQTIKDAINYVSGVRGDLGAVQNRLEHTANNLSVMAENIQDAESTIRDTDVAEEMMAYTKNNILIQSAQAMLAQANAVPQGVLQLLG